MRTFGKIILGILIIGVGAVVMLVFAVRGVVKNVHVQESGESGQKTVNVDTPFGHVRVHENDQLDPALVGIPIYPGATRSKDKGGAEFQFDGGDVHKDFTVAGAVYYTGDSLEKVREFYREKFPDWNTKWENGEYRVETKADGHLRSVAIKREDDRTRIGVASVGPPASN